MGINPSAKKISSNKNSRLASLELPQNLVTFSGLEVCMAGRYREVFGTELFSEPVDLLAGVAEDDGLGDIESIVEVGQNVELPLLPLAVDVELADSY